MPEITVYKIAGVFETGGVTKGANQFGAEMGRVKKFVNETKREMKGLYELAPIRKTNYSATEQAVRDEMAARIKAMRQSAFSENVNAEVNNRLFGGAEAVSAASAAGQQVGGGFLDGLNSIMGRGSDAAKWVKLLKGGGALFAAGKGASIFADMGAEVKTLAEAFGRGELSAGELGLKLAESVPILGKLVKGAVDFAAALSGVSAAEARRAEDRRKQLEANQKFESASGAGSQALAGHVTALENMNATNPLTRSQLEAARIRKEAADQARELEHQATLQGSYELSDQGQAVMAAGEARARKVIQEGVREYDAEMKKARDDHNKEVEQRMRERRSEEAQGIDENIRKETKAQEDIAARMKTRRDEEQAGIKANADLAQSIVEKTMTKQERFQKELAEINRLTSIGALTDEQGAKAAGRLAGEFGGGGANRELEGRQFRFASEIGPDSGIKDLTAQQLQALLKSNGLQQQLVDLVKDQKPGEVVSMN
jgi:hypothetical protein